MTKLKPILRVIDLVGDGRSMTLPVHPKVIARTHCVRFMDTYNGAEASIFMAADGWLMMRRVGNVWAWPPSDDVQAGAMLYAIGELVECNDKGEPQVSSRIDEAWRLVEAHEMALGAEDDDGWKATRAALLRALGVPS